MAFQDIKTVESANFYLDLAFKRAGKRSSLKKVPRTSSRFDKIKTLELAKVESFHGVLISKLNSILDSFPRITDFSFFYYELVKITFGKRDYVSSLSNIMWSCKKLDSFFSVYDRKIKSARDLSSVHRFKREFFGRSSSILKSLNKDFLFLKKVRIILQSFPVVKTKLKKIAIAGFPNVGKSTLLSKLSGSRPEIAAYPFTTKKTMIGYITKDNKKVIQLLDTPGTLNRPDKMNFIEKQAYLIMKLVADKIIFIIDLTEPYPLKDQLKLLKKIKEFKKPIIIYLSKTDILDKEKIDAFAKKHKCFFDIQNLKSNLF